MRKVKNENVIEITEEINIGNVILEKGDKIQLVNEAESSEECLNIIHRNEKLVQDELTYFLYKNFDSEVYNVDYYTERGKTMAMFNKGLAFPNEEVSGEVLLTDKGNLKFNLASRYQSKSFKLKF